jgi:hypothetical protein
MAYQLLAHIENDRGNGADALDLLDRGYPVVVAAGNRYYKVLFQLERARALALTGAKEEGRSSVPATGIRMGCCVLRVGRAM